MTSHKSLVIVSQVISKRKAKSLLQTIGRRLFRRKTNWAGRRRTQLLVLVILFVLPFIFLLCVVLFKNDQMEDLTVIELMGDIKMPSHLAIPSASKPKRKKLKRILYWTEYFGTKDYPFKLGDKTFKMAGCRVSNCQLTDDRNLLNTSDAVIFHINDFDDRDLPDPIHRLAHQRFIFYNFETMDGYQDYPFFKKTHNFFNWTMTYRRDSDIYDAWTYGAIRRRTNALPPPTSMPIRLGLDVLPPDPAAMMMPSSRHLLLAKKTKMVAWFVSHCRTESLREKYFQWLGQHVPIDTYGSCGSLKCVPVRSEKCDVELLDSYKFYVAAENALCPDYVTEKFYRALAADIVPIVYGGADYSAYAPPSSYIDAGDFKSPKALADYLKLLDQNDGLYLKYFDWKKNYEVVNWPVSGWCQLCEKLNDAQQTPKVYQDMTDWWFHQNIPCLSGYDYLEHLLQQDAKDNQQR